MVFSSRENLLFSVFCQKSPMSLNNFFIFWKIAISHCRIVKLRNILLFCSEIQKCHIINNGIFLYFLAMLQQQSLTFLNFLNLQYKSFNDKNLAQFVTFFNFICLGLVVKYGTDELSCRDYSRRQINLTYIIWKGNK